MATIGEHDEFNVGSDWTEAVEALLAEYRRIDRESLRLPAFGTISQYGGAFIRQFRATSVGEAANDFSAPWRGEAVLLSFGTVSRPLVSSLLVAHFRRRLTLLRRWLVLEESPADHHRAALQSVEAALELWRGRRSLSGAITLLISLLGAVGGIVGVANGVQDVSWAGLLVAIPLLVIAYLFVVGSYVSKRGLMLGGTATTTYVPTLIRGRGAYGREQEVFGAIQIGRREIPFDLILAELLIALVASAAFAGRVWWLGGVFTAFLLFNVLAYVRRIWLGRC